MIIETTCHLTAFRQIAEIAASGEGRGRILSAAAAAIHRHFEWEHVGILVLDEATRRVVLEALATDAEHCFQVGDAWPMDSGVVEDVLSTQTHRFLRYAGYERDELPGVIDFPVQLIVPVKHGDCVVGVLHLAGSDCGGVDGQLEGLETIAVILAGAIVTARRTSLMQIMAEIARLAVESDELRPMLKRTVEFITQQLRVTVASILMLNPEGTHFAYEVVAGDLPLDSMDNEPVTTGVSGRCVRTGLPQLVTEPARDPDYEPGHEAVESEYLVPIVYAGKILGVLNLESMRRDAFTDEAQHVFRGIALQIAGAIHLLNTKERLQRKDVENTQLLHNILPRHVIRDLRASGRVTPQYYSEATVLFTDFTGFTRTAEVLATQELLEALNEYFSLFDEVAVRYGLEKIKTIGDAYMCVAGVPDRRQSNAIDAILAAWAFRDLTRALSRSRGLEWDVRIGIHSGPLISGVIGTRKLTYDVWGSTVNLAARVQEAGAPGEVTISGGSRTLARDFFELRDRGRIETKEGLSIELSEVTRLQPTLITGTDTNFARRYELYYRKDFPGLPESLGTGLPSHES